MCSKFLNTRQYSTTINSYTICEVVRVLTPYTILESHTCYVYKILNIFAGCSYKYFW